MKISNIDEAYSILKYLRRFNYERNNSTKDFICNNTD